MTELFYTAIANQIEKKIIDGELAEGEKLPSERNLAVEYGVSRPVVREALRVLNEKGFIQVIVGKGIYIRLPKDEYLTEKFETIIDTQNITKEQIMQARQVLESGIAKLAAKCAKPEAIDRLEDLYAQMDHSIGNLRRFTALDAQFHWQLAASTGNTLLELISTTLNKVTDRQQLFEANDSALRANAQKEHRAIIDAIRSGDEALLEAAIERHIQCFGSHLPI